MKIRVCQLRPRLGDIEANTQIALHEIRASRDDIICFSELFLVGYPPTDEWFNMDAHNKIEVAIDALIYESKSSNALIIIGTPRFDGVYWRNSALAISNGVILHQHHKCCLPTYDIFNEPRYFVPGTSIESFRWNGYTLALLICEDIWADQYPGHYTFDPVLELKTSFVNQLFHITASPFESGKKEKRQQQLKRVTNETSAPIVSINQVGGYADLLFDGQSMALNNKGQVFFESPAFQACSKTIVEMNLKRQPVDDWDELLLGLTFGIREYTHHTGFSSVIIGASGGIDSALVAALAVEALGKENVTLVTLPTIFNSEETQMDAKRLADQLSVPLITIPIETYRADFNHNLAEAEGELNTIAKQNIQARIRGVILMALSNQRGDLLLTTGNKSELAMGYSTLYGDMCGGLNPIGDLFKTDVISLANHMNQVKQCIPDRIIERPPSAELAPNQRDDDTLPPYNVLDQILHQKIIQGFSFNKLIELNDKEHVVFVLKRLKDNEFKRFQSPPILRISSKAFGRGWQYPLVN